MNPLAARPDQFDNFFFLFKVGEHRMDGSFWQVLGRGSGPRCSPARVGLG
jgi:hypothetical protein